MPSTVFAQTLLQEFFDHLPHFQGFEVSGLGVDDITRVLCPHVRIGPVKVTLRALKRRGGRRPVLKPPHNSGLGPARSTRRPSL